MPSTVTSILDGLSTSVAVKAPCRTVATTDITLSGLQTISGYTTVEDDRVLVKGQTNPVDNGIYMASTGSWTRAKDADGNRDLVQGTRVIIRSTTVDGVEYELTTANPITIGTSSLTFELRYGANAVYDQIEEEIAASIIPSNTSIPSADIDGIVRPERYGAVGDFDPSTGAGTDDRQAFIDAFAVARQFSAGCTVDLGSRRYYMGTGQIAHHATTNPGTAQVALGVGGTQSSFKNITVRGDGAEVYQGSAGKCWCLYEADNARITGIKFFGYTGGVLSGARQNDTPLSISNRSKNVRVDNCYITNSLGDQIAIYGDLAALATDRYCSNITIDHCVLKERYGNGTASGSSGTKSRFAMAVIDVVGLNVHDNLIYGYVDLEPNLNTDHIVDALVTTNRFRSGHVTAQSSIGTDYWHDEPTALSGGSIIEQGVALVSVGSPIRSNVRVQDNNIEFGKITMGGGNQTIDITARNMFESGIIQVGTTNAARATIVDNVAHAPYTAETAFIKLTSSLANSVISRNHAMTSGSWDFCVDTDGAGADGGANTFEGNVCEGGVNLGFAPATSSVVDYYVGTWTPVLTFATPGDLSVAYAGGGQIGRYVRRFKSVELTLFRTVLSTFTHTTAVGALQITGLPYPALTSSGASWQGTLRWDGITKANYTQVTPKIESGASLITFEAAGSAQARSDVSVANLPSGGTPGLIGSLTYEIAA